MSGAGWALRRLAAMSPGEVAHRARIALRDRLAPPRWERFAPERAFRELFSGGADRALASSRLDAWLARPGTSPGVPRLAREDIAPALDEAAALAAGRWTLFGREARLDDPPRWRAHPLTGAEWPDAPGRALDYRRSDAAGGAKWTWELGRLGVLPTLALAADAAAEPDHAARAARWLDDFGATQPFGRGIHHASGIEQAVRVLTASATLAWLDPLGPRPDAARALGLLAQQAHHLRAHLSLGSSANNHLIAEYAALAAAGALWPTMRGAARLAREGLDGLEREVLRQFHPDGVNAEQAFGYLPFVWELVLLGLRAGEAAGRATPPAVRERLAESLEFARAIRLPGGRWPQVGDEDDGRVLLGSEGWSRLDLVGNALAAWLDRDALGPGHAAYAWLLTGHPPRPPRAAADGARLFPDGGWSVWRRDGLLVTLGHGPLGLGPIAAHGHADALAVTVFVGADGVVVDPGTFAYHEDPAARDRCRSTPAHATVHFGGRSQAEVLGPFLWGRRARVERDGDAWACAWPGGERHARHLRVEGGAVRIEDRVTGPDARLAFPLAPGAVARLEGGDAVVESGAAGARFRFEGVADLAVEPAEHAVRFARRVPALRLVGRIAGPACVTVIETRRR